LVYPKKTVRRRVRDGRLQPTQMPTHNGYTWMVEVPDGTAAPENGELQALRERVQSLEVDLEARRQDSRLLVIALLSGCFQFLQFGFP
jgi:hypothetical protein